MFTQKEDKTRWYDSLPNWIQAMIAIFMIIAGFFGIYNAIASGLAVLTTKVEAHESRLCRVENAAADIGEMRTDIKWLKQWAERH